MTAPINSTIGTASRNYVSIETWAADLPTNITTGAGAGNYVATLYNDGAFNHSGPGYHISLGGTTTDATHTILITAASGQAWCDNPGAIGLPAQSRGVYLDSGFDDHRSLTLQTSGTMYLTLERLQIKAGLRGLASNIGNGAPVTFRNCLIQLPNSHVAVDLDAAGDLAMYGNVVMRTSGRGSFLSTSRGTQTITLTNNTFVELDTSGTAVPFQTTSGNSSKTLVLYNNALFGFSPFTDAGTVSGWSGDNNATSLSSFPVGSSNQLSKSASTEFRAVGTSAPDLRLPASGGSLVNAGQARSVATADCFGTARPQGAAWDIGAFELPVTVVSRPLLTVVA